MIVNRDLAADLIFSTPYSRVLPFSFIKTDTNSILFLRTRKKTFVDFLLPDSVKKDLSLRPPPSGGPVIAERIAVTAFLPRHFGFVHNATTHFGRLRGQVTRSGRTRTRAGRCHGRLACSGGWLRLRTQADVVARAITGPGDTVPPRRDLSGKKQGETKMSREPIADAESVFKIYPRSEQELVPTITQGNLHRKENEPEISFEVEALGSAVDTHILNAKEIQENEDQAKAKSDEGPMAPFLS